MTEQSGNPVLAEETINKSARRARNLRTCMRGIVWTTLPCAFAMMSVLIANAARHQPDNQSLCFWMLLMASPMLPFFLWMVAELALQSMSRREFSDVFVEGHSADRQGVSSALIGPLLDITMAGAVNGNILPLPTALLGDLLKTVRAEDEVVLTADQRHFLYRLVIRGHWDSINSLYGPEIGESVFCELRPAAIDALAVLGNSSSISVLGRFARKTKDSVLRQSALHSIKQIRERMRFGPDQMLRASRAPDHPDTLLRAAAGDKPHRDGKQLLRADKAAVGVQGKSERQQAGEQAHAPDAVLGRIEVK
jgi:hypothetical protein